jgi:ABC-type transporter MlaC component
MVLDPRFLRSKCQKRAWNTGLWPVRQAGILSAFDSRSGVQLRWARRPGGLCSITSSLIIAACALVIGCQRGPNPADTVRNAYAWYLRELKSGVNPLEQKRAELKEFVTDNFLASIDNMRPELEATAFMDAQSFDAKLSIEKVTNDRRAATVRIGLSGRLSGQHALNVYLVKVNGRWKVDDVKLLEELSLAEKSERPG